MLRCVPTSKMVLTSKDTFEFDVEFEYTKTDEYFLAVSMLDTRRGGIPYDSGSIKMGVGGNGKQSVHFSLPLNIFNNGTYKITASFAQAGSRRSTPHFVAGFSNDENSCLFSINEDAKGTDYALLKYDAVDLRRS
mgnify:CR=1 FL=1